MVTGAGGGVYTGASVVAGGTYTGSVVAGTCWSVAVSSYWGTSGTTAASLVVVLGVVVRAGCVVVGVAVVVRTVVVEVTTVVSDSDFGGSSLNAPIPTNPTTTAPAIHGHFLRFRSGPAGVSDPLDPVTGANTRVGSVISVGRVCAVHCWPSQ